MALVRKLLSLGVPVSMNLVESAVKRRSLDLLSLLLEYGLDINKEVEWCFPPPLSSGPVTYPLLLRLLTTFRLALDAEADELVVAWFFDHGADPDARCQMDMTPLSIAMQYAPLTIIRMLLVHTPAPQHGQLLHYAARRTSHDSGQVIDLVLQHCKNLEVNDIMYHNHAFSFEIRKCVGLGTALHEAAITGTPDTVRLLISRGTDTKIPNTRGQTALKAAEELGNREVAELLR